jgi:hypothetical protein
MNGDETNLHETNLYDEDGVLRAILVEPPQSACRSICRLPCTGGSSLCAPRPG